MAVLGLPKDPFSSEPDATFYYNFDSFEQRLKVLKGLVRGTDLLVLVIGEPGSGKTTLLNRYLATTEVDWRPVRIQTNPQNTLTRSPQQQGHRGYPAYIMQDSADPIVILDDAHLLPQKELAFLLREALITGSTNKIKRLVLLGESELYNAVSSLTATFSTLPAVNKIYLPGLTEKQTAAYLRHRLTVAGYARKIPFNSSAIKKIHQTSGGYPGQINEIAHQWLDVKYSHKKESQNMLKNLSAPTGRTVAWVAAGFIIILLVALWLFADRKPTGSTSLDQKKSKIVLRKKIPPDSQLAKNVIRKKVTVVNPPTETKATPPAEIIASVNPPSETKTTPPAEIIASITPPTETKTTPPEEIIASVKPPSETKATPPAEIIASVKPSTEEKTTPPEANKFSAKPLTEVKMKQPVRDKTVPPEPAIEVSTKAKPRQITKLKPSVALTQQSRPQAARPKIDKRAVQRERWILNQDSKFYTIQIIGVHSEQTLSEFVQKNQLLEQNEIAYYKSTFKGKAWYQLLYGVYPTKKDAELAARKLPENIGKAGPWIRRLAKVQQVIRRKAEQ